MTEQELFRRLHELAESDAEGLRKLAEEISLVCREPARTVLSAWAGGPPQRRIPCAFVSSQLKELAVAGMLGQADLVAPGMRVQLMEMVVAQQLEFRELMLTVLEPLLKDETSTGIAASGGVLRTCDAAYLLARRIVRSDASEAEQFSAEDEFVAHQQIQRDEEIDQWLTSKTWKEIFPDPW